MYYSSRLLRIMEIKSGRIFPIFLFRKVYCGYSLESPYRLAKAVFMSICNIMFLRIDDDILKISPFSFFIWSFMYSCYLHKVLLGRISVEYIYC